MHTGTLAILLIFGFPIVIVAGFFLIWALKIWKGDGKQDAATRSEEARLMQELHQGLIKMEKRIDSLETILLDPDRKAEGKDHEA